MCLLFISGHLFPASKPTDGASHSVRFQRGRRQTLACQCELQTLDAALSVVYWSTGEGVSTETDIVGVRFADGTFLRNGLDYSIGSDASLTVYSFGVERDVTRFWCHVFYSNGTKESCYTDLSISG